MAITISEQGEVTIVEVRNDITSETVDEFKEILEHLAELPQRRVVMDLTEVNYLCSSGLAIIGKSLHRILDQGGKMAVAGGQRRVLRLFAMTRLSDLLPCHATKEEALQGVQLP